MSEKIEPALSANDIEALNSLGAINHVGGLVEFIGRAAFTGAWHKVIAAANRELPDSDPRKITRAKVAVLRKLIDAMYGDESGGVLNRVYTSPAENRHLWSLADALESYLPPVGIE